MDEPPNATLHLAKTILSQTVRDHTEALDVLLVDVSDAFARAVDVVRNCLDIGGQILLCGNGGSAADAQHFAAELIGRPQPWRALALTVDTSTITALANDHGYDAVFSRQVRAHGRAGDVLLALSTSGRSPNVLAAIVEAKRCGLTTIGLSGPSPHPLARASDICLSVNAPGVSRVQELHILLLHALWEALEAIR